MFLRVHVQKHGPPRLPPEAEARNDGPLHRKLAPAGNIMMAARRHRRHRVDSFRRGVS